MVTNNTKKDMQVVMKYIHPIQGKFYIIIIQRVVHFAKLKVIRNIDVLLRRILVN